MRTRLLCDAEFENGVIERKGAAAIGMAGLVAMIVMTSIDSDK